MIGNVTKHAYTSLKRGSLRVQACVFAVAPLPLVIDLLTRVLFAAFQLHSVTFAEHGVHLFVFSDE